jgi:hypothetical protein
MQIVTSPKTDIWQQYQNARPVNNEQSLDSDIQTKESDKKSLQKSDDELLEDEKRVISELQARDSEVRSHEAAHQAAGGGLAGGASFSYQKGPDGKMYAVGGEVPITLKKGQTPQETIANARQIKAAALAPAKPSPQDYAVANTAVMMELKAQQEVIKEQQSKLEGKKGYEQYALNTQQF